VVYVLRLYRPIIRGRQRANPHLEKQRLSHVPRCPGPPLGSVDGPSIIHRETENGAKVSSRERCLSHRAARAGRSADPGGKPRRRCLRVQQWVALFCQQWRKTSARSRARQLDERKRQPGRRVVPSGEESAQMRPHLGPWGRERGTRHRVETKPSGRGDATCLAVKTKRSGRRFAEMRTNTG